MYPQVCRWELIVWQLPPHLTLLLQDLGGAQDHETLKMSRQKGGGGDRGEAGFGHKVNRRKGKR